MQPQTTGIDTSRVSGKKENPGGLPPGADRSPAKPANTGPLTPDEVVKLKDDIVAVLCTCFDPEIPVNIYELGLIYDIIITPSGEVEIRMTLTSPACPVAGSLPGDVKRRVETLGRITSVKVEVVWEPPWDKSRMSEAAKLQLGIDD